MRRGRKEGRKEGLRSGESQSNPFFRQTRVTRASERFRCVALFAFCPVPVFGPQPLFVSLWRDRAHRYFKARATPRVRATTAAACGAARRGTLLIKYLKQSMKANKRCHVGSEEGGSGAEREEGEGKAELGCLVCLPVSADVSGEIRVERGVGSAAISSSRRERETERPRQFAVRRYHPS